MTIVNLRLVNKISVAIVTYLQQGIASRLGSKQLQGLFAVQLANLTLERDAKLWASGGAVFMLLSFILYTISRLFPGITVSPQALLALIPLLIAFPEMLLLFLSRQLVYRADRLAARTLVLSRHPAGLSGGPGGAGKGGGG